jgi:hypothetical protein
MIWVPKHELDYYTYLIPTNLPTYPIFLLCFSTFLLKYNNSFDSINESTNMFSRIEQAGAEWKRVLVGFINLNTADARTARAKDSIALVVEEGRESFKVQSLR